MKVLTILKTCVAVVLAAETMILTGCGAGPGGADTASTANDVPIAYVKRPINSQSMNSVVGNPTDSVTFHAGGDLYIRDISSPSATPGWELREPLCCARLNSGNARDSGLGDSTGRHITGLRFSEMNRQ